MLPYALVVEEAALAEDNRQNTPFYAPKKPPGDDFAALAWAFGQGRDTEPRERSLDCSRGFCGGLRSLDNIAVFLFSHCFSVCASVPVVLLSRSHLCVALSR